MPERHMEWLPPTRNWAHNMDMWPYQELSQQPFSVPDDPQPTKPHWVGPDFVIFKSDGEWLWSLSEDDIAPHKLRKQKQKENEQVWNVNLIK